MEVNEYDQHGEYFIKAWEHTPSDKELLKAMKSQDYSNNFKIDLDVVRSCEGRIEPYTQQDCWFYLRDVN